MLKFAALISCGLIVCWQLGAQQSDQEPAVPPNHPTVTPQLPAGHPPLGQDNPDALKPPPEANPEDVKSVDAIIKAYYATISGPRGQPRDWNRLRSLLMPETHFVTTRPLDNGAMPMVLSVEQFIELNHDYFEKGGYFEDEINHRVDVFGNIAQVFSTYESRRTREDPQPYSRGINSIQLLNDGRRWWIASIMWDFERPDVNPIPAEYQPKSPPASK